MRQISGYGCPRNLRNTENGFQGNLPSIALPVPIPSHSHTAWAINELIVEAAVKLGLEDGSKLRVDTTVVETDIHHPTDNTLLWDVMRVLTQLLGRLGEALELRCIAGFRNRSRAAHRRMYEIQRMPTRQREGVGSPTDRGLPGADRDCRGGGGERQGGA
jgi:hypothetical protein